LVVPLFAGNRAAQILSQELPEGWRVVLIDRNSHMNHLYTLPRFAILPEHGHKAFIPYTNIFGKPTAPSEAKTRHIFLRAQVTSLNAHSLTLSRSFPEHGIDERDKTLRFDYLVYALGSHLPAPINVWGPADVEKELETPILHDGTKASALSWLSRFRAMIERNSSVLVVGGGALGIRKLTKCSS
jgi:apoptosis-inducing factor 2